MSSKSPKLTEEREAALHELEGKLQYTFSDLTLLETALTHSSYANEQGPGHKYTERLEFLGDSVLGFITADKFFHAFRDIPEGRLTKLRASTVCEESLFEFAKQIDLGSYLLLGKGEEKNGGRERASIVSDAFEAVIAAIYLDGSIDPAREFVLRFVMTAVEEKTITFKDYKTQLQEIIQKNPEEKLTYVLSGESGPDHDKRFEVEVHLNSNVIGKGIGRTKKQAEQEAAREALSLMGLS
ncbi:MAG: ribonuclease III [Clostridia bacterium]|nr:ribonuclease III [Clostridia bacterium]